ncbi:NAD(P)-binding protein [Metabacillus fastidiosus]|uniref:NAD(P)-binding protein n=1 Tax=Metabacillus fastidiosus TaxID=1458 RepID=UPI00082439D9|nr:NAD(P)-binding protein [Metabacillus fastidiosus]MED4461195.1 NAD(P)-binding protein [Metabacillus fastidiosus]
MASSTVVVGGGIAGILAALMLKDRFENVVLIENSDELGGLLRSDHYDNQYWFDKGTHIPALTYNEEINKYLFPKQLYNENLWLRFSYLKPGNYFNNNLNNESSSIDITSYGKEKYCKMLIDLFNSNLEPKLHYINAYEQIMDLFGETLTREVFDQISYKFFGVSLKKLSQDAFKLVFNPRIIAFDEKKTKEFKKIKFFDLRLSLRSPIINESITYFYPVEGGINLWIKMLEEKMGNKGIKILKNTSISDIKLKDGNISELILGEGNECLKNISHIVWTAPTHLLAQRYKIINIESLKNESNQNLKRATYLYHFICNKPFLTDRQYVTCYDPIMRTFRVTLYNNFQKSDQFRCSVEVLSEDNIAIAEEIIFKELITMGIVSEDTLIEKSYSYKLGSYFPIITPYMEELHSNIVNTVSDKISNITLVQRSGNQFFMADVLENVYKCVSKIIKY